MAFSSWVSSGIFIWRLFGLRVFVIMIITNYLVSRKFSVYCSRFRLQIRNACGLSCMIVIKQVISLHKLLNFKLSQWLVHRYSTQINCFKHWRSKCLAFCWSDSLIFVIFVSRFVLIHIFGTFKMFSRKVGLFGNDIRLF